MKKVYLRITPAELTSTIKQIEKVLLKSVQATIASLNIHIDFRIIVGELLRAYWILLIVKATSNANYRAEITVQYLIKQLAEPTITSSSRYPIKKHPIT